MEKNYKANYEYNKKKRNNTLLLGILLIVCLLGTMSIFIVSKQYMFVAFFGIFLVLPIIIIPSAFKQYPLDNRDLITITDKTIKTEDKEYKLKDIIKIKVYIELPASKLDSENKKRLEEMKTIKPEDCWYGNFDIYVKDEKGKPKVIYTHIDHCIDALETVTSLGFKHYKLIYSLKKQSVESEYDFCRVQALKKEKQLQEISAKNRLKQLL